MTLKDWRKFKNGERAKFGYSFIKKGTDKKYGFSSSVQVMKTYKGWNTEINGLDRPYISKKFQQKSQALKFAKNYMRRH
jgi:hypothetical protein